MNKLSTSIAALALAGSAFANDTDKGVVKLMQTEPVKYSSLGSVTVFWTDVRTGLSTEINNINFLPGKPVLNVWGVSNMAGDTFTGGGLAWNLVENRNGDFRVSATLGVSFDMSFGKLSKFQPGVGFQVNWKTN